MRRHEDDLLSGWLAEGPRHGPADSFDALIDRVTASAQRPGWIVAFTRGTIGTTVSGSVLRYGAFALMVVALVGLLLGSMVAGGVLRPEPAIVVEESRSPVASATFTPMDLATPGDLPAAALLAPGTYSARNPYSDRDPVRSCERGCADYRVLTFDLPAGWATRNGLVYKHLGEQTEVAFSVWTPDMVYLDACQWRESALAELLDIHDHGRQPELGSTALMSQVGRSASSPSVVTVGGQMALRIELTIPAELDIAGCDRGEFRSWTEWDVDGGANSHHAPGQTDVVYIVDVDRRPFVIDASHLPGASPEDLAELEAILASMVIQR